MAQQQHPAYRGLQDYSALKQRSDANYDAQDAALRTPDLGYGSYNNTMNLIANSQNKQSPWAPWFQSLSDQGVTGLGQDTGRPHGISDAPGYWGKPSANAIPAQPLMASNNIAGAQPVTQRTLALEGLGKAGPQAAIYDPNELSSILAQLQPKPAGK